MVNMAIAVDSSDGNENVSRLVSSTKMKRGSKKKYGFLSTGKITDHESGEWCVVEVDGYCFIFSRALQSCLPSVTESGFSPTRACIREKTNWKMIIVWKNHGIYRNQNATSSLAMSRNQCEQKEVRRRKRMIRCMLPHTGVWFATILSALVICSVHLPVAAWGPRLAGSSPIPSASPEGRESLNGEESRKGFLSKSLNSCLGLFLVSAEKATAAETVGKDPDCDDITCLGVWDGLLAGEYTLSQKLRFCGY